MTFISQLALLWLLAFGFGYAARVARRPFRPTWLMVVVGVGGTLAGISAILWDLSRDWLVALGVPWGGFAVTGGAMILGQVWKARYQRREAHAHLHDDEDDGDHHAQSQAVALPGQASTRQDPGTGAGRPGQGREN